MLGLPFCDCHQSDIVAACPSGHVMADGGNCEPCPRGYFKDNDKGPEFTFGQCERCPEEFITAGTGATSVDQCNVGEWNKTRYSQLSPCKWNLRKSKKYFCLTIICK